MNTDRVQQSGGIANPTQNMRLSYGDAANPRRLGTIVGLVTSQWGDEWWVEFDDGDETRSDLRQHGWREELPTVPFVEAVHDVRFGPIRTPPQIVSQARLELTNILGPHLVRGGAMTFYDQDEKTSGISFAIDPISDMNKLVAFFAKIAGAIERPSLALMRKVRWKRGASCLYIHVFFHAEAT